MFTVQGTVPRDAAFTRALCADKQGFTRHAAVRCGAHERQRLEQLSRTIRRPALANKRVQCNRRRAGRAQAQDRLARGHHPHRDIAAYVHAAPGRAGASTESGCAHGRPARINWARLLKRVFEIDMEHCPNCGSELEIIAAILESGLIERILTHLGLQARGPPRAPARGYMQHAA